MNKERWTLQSIEPKQAHFCLHICQFLEEIDFDVYDKKMIVGLSGGLDSTAVLLFLKLIQKKYRLELCAVHINHLLREEASSEALHVKKLCNALQVPCIVIEKDVCALALEWKKGIEESARIVRYTIFKEELAKRNFDYIALGHHLNDLAEDVLMRQIRGTSLEQSLGMQAIDRQRKLVRPFLCTEKEKLQKLVLSCGLNWVEDASNSSDEYFRNRVRHSILPLILQENPAYLKNIAQNWRQGQHDKAYWKQAMQGYLVDFIQGEQASYSIKRKDFCNEEKALRLRILAEIVRLLKSQPQAELLFKMDALILKNESNKMLALNNKLTMFVEQKKVRFERKEIIQPNELQ